MSCAAPGAGPADRAQRPPYHARASRLPSLVAGIDRRALDEVDSPGDRVVAWRRSAVPAPRLVEVIGPFDDEQPARRRLEAAPADLARHASVHAERLVVIADDPIAGLDRCGRRPRRPVFVAVSARYTDGRLHWHSTTQRLVAHAPCPVLVVPARPCPLPLRRCPARPCRARRVPRPSTGRRPAGVDRCASLRRRAGWRCCAKGAPRATAESTKSGPDPGDAPPRPMPCSTTSRRRRRHRPAGQRRTGLGARCDRGARRPLRRAADPPDARPARPAVPARRVRRSHPPPLVLPVPRHPAVLRRRHASTSSRPTSPRCATS